MTQRAHLLLLIWKLMSWPWLSATFMLQTQMIQISLQMWANKCYLLNAMKLLSAEISTLFWCLKSKKQVGNQRTQWNSLKELKYIQENLDLTDIWRDLNPEAKRYTWRRNRPDCALPSRFRFGYLKHCWKNLKRWYSSGLQNRTLFM